MKASLLLQQLIVFSLVAFSVMYALRQLAPALYRRGQVALAVRLLQPQRMAALRWIGRRLAPVPKAAGFFAAPKAAASCGGCNNCGPTEPAADKSCH